MAESALHIGDMFRQEEQFNKALTWYESANRLSLFLPPTTRSRLALDAECGRALALRGMGRFQEASKAFARLVNAYAKIKDRVGQAYTRWALGTTQRFEGLIGMAEKNLRRSLRFAAPGNDKAYTLCGLGGTLRMKGWAAQSGRLYQAAQRLFEREGDLFGLAYAHCGQGNAARMSNRLPSAMRHYRRAIKTYESIGQEGPLAFVYWSRAQAEISLGQHGPAKKDLMRAERLFRSVNDKRGLIYVNLGWGTYYKKAGQARFRSYFQRALREAQKGGLRLEILHAKKGLSGKDEKRALQHLGVDVNKFTAYKTIP